MKNLKKLVSVIVTVAMLISSFAAIGVSAAEYGDVDTTNGYYKAIKVLSGLGVVKGDDEGNFNPTNDIKRSEAIALVCRVVGEEAVAKATSGASFDDVAANHWAAGYIKWGVDSEIVKGDDEGNFNPDDSVTFQDMVVMVMRALGYERIAQRKENGGYPTGYLKLAGQRGVTAYTNDYTGAKTATREVVAQVIYNALTAPIVDISYYGETPEDDRYTIFDGSNDESPLRTVLTYKNEIYKVKATVEDTAKTDASLRKDLDNLKVALDVTGTYDYDEDYVQDKVGFANDGKLTILAGDTDVADYLGYTVEAYIAENEDGDMELLAVAVDSKSTVSETVTENFESFDAVLDSEGEVKGYVFEYYADEDDARTTEIDVAKNYAVYYNGSKISATDVATLAGDIETLLVDKANSITFMGPRNADYTKIFVTDYVYAQVDSVKAEEEYIKFSSGAGALSLNAEDRDNETFTYNLYDADGNAIELADVQEKDIFNIVAPATAGVVDLDAAPYMDIYVTSNAVTGSVTEKITNEKYKIDGKVYVVDSNASIKTGDEGTFYITIDGKVYAADASSVVNKNYSFIAAYGVEAAFGVNTHQLKLFTAEGLETYDVAATLRVYDVYTVDDPDSDDPLDTIDEYGYETYKRADGTQDAFFADIETIVSPVVAAAETDDDKADAKAAAEAALAARVVTYKLNSNGEIQELRFAGAGAYEFAATARDSKYNDDLQTFGGEDLDANSKLFIAPVTAITVDGKTAYTVDEEDLAMGAFASIDEDDSYDAYLFMFEDDDYLGAAIVGKEIDSSLKTCHLAMVKSISTGLDAEGSPVTIYTFVQSGETLTKAVDYDKASEVAEMTIGDVFLYTVNAEDEINKSELIFDVAADGTYSAASLVANYPNTVEGIAANDRAIIFGEVAEVEGDKLTVGSLKAKMNDTEGNTYAQFEVARFATSNPSNAVKALKGYGYIKESYGRNVYEVVAVVNEDGRFEDIVQFFKVV